MIYSLRAIWYHYFSAFFMWVATEFEKTAIVSLLLADPKYRKECSVPLNDNHLFICVMPAEAPDAPVYVTLVQAKSGQQIVNLLRPTPLFVKSITDFRLDGLRDIHKIWKSLQ